MSHVLLLLLLSDRGSGGVAAWPQGVSASYLGIAESVMQFTLYEALKGSPLSQSLAQYGSGWQHTGFFLMGAFAKLTASVITYPHEVVRTRLRQVDAQK